MFHVRIEQYIYFSFEYVVFSSNNGSEFSIEILLVETKCMFGRRECDENGTSILI